MEKKDNQHQFLPNEILEELNIKNNESENFCIESNIRPIIEPHQIKLSIPSKIAKEVDFKMEKIEEKIKPKKIKIKLDIKNKQIIFKY